MKIEIFEKAIAAEEKEWEHGKETEYYKKYESYPEETEKKVKEIRKKYGCPGVAILRAYNETKWYNYDKILLETFFESEGNDLLETLETGKIKEFYIRGASTALMRNIHFLANAGWNLKPEVIEHPYFTDFDGKKEKIETIKFYK